VVKWLTAIYTLIISVLIALVILTFTGTIHPQDTLIRYAQSVPALAPYVETYYIGADWEKWHGQRQAELEAEKLELEQIRTELELKQRQLEELSDRLDRQEEALAAAREKQLNTANLAQLYTQMRPQEAVAILQLMEQDLVLDILTAMDHETAAVILAALPPDMAAQLSAKFR
jgi:flagellar motility protein MotE (MotC chaperone)